jgi:hypothetical protein
VHTSSAGLIRSAYGSTATGNHFMNLSMPPSVNFSGVLTDANGKPPNQREIAMAKLPNDI